MTTFNYDNIPLGYYDDIAYSKSGMRSFWHNQKFQRIIDLFPDKIDSVLDFGCFSGTFLSLIPKETCDKQVGIDIIEDQIKYANTHYSRAYRKFYFNTKRRKLLDGDQFEYVTLIEVIEHLNHDEIVDIMDDIYNLLQPKGKFILTTPNYLSLWPLLEFFLNRVSDVSYEEQHITKFSIFNFKHKMNQIVPEFKQKFDIEFITTTHFLSPYVALVSYRFAAFISKRIKHKKWKFPFGSLILIQLCKK